MAALAVHGALPLLRRPLLAKSLFARPLSTPFFAAIPFLAASRTWAFPSLESLLELLPPFVLAVPKKKVSHSRKSMREANKGLKDKHNIVSCPGCGAPKLAHHLCSNCFSFLTRMWKQTKRETNPP
ncbi:ribosomal L32p protein family-domain-containing protein [Mycena maculata]|uniref:Large ribosomal subunit protein bL32m n=1 Tax=Mycena maculata TaxID=230809 RepID=A0AAD7KFY0_9AGAR|nr:ribosomal L32p protein family-domain-containing protein [Mycena maculata]